LSNVSLGAAARGSVRPATVAIRLSVQSTLALVYRDVPVVLTMGAQRLLALLALHPAPLRRAYVAGTLWPETSEERAHANLRSALWRVHRIGRDLVEASGPCLQLGGSVEVDLRASEAAARRVLGGDSADVDGVDLAMLLDGDVLPDWYEDWVLLERERFRQLRLQALDSLCERLTRAGRLGEALEVGLAALAIEPLRESAHRALVQIHLANGNASEGFRQYRLYCRLLDEHLGIKPSEQMEQLVHSLTAAGPVA
jgi:DNA-binding SARP family transcriptional activator